MTIDIVKNAVDNLKDGYIEKFEGACESLKDRVLLLNLLDYPAIGISYERGFYGRYFFKTMAEAVESYKRALDKYGCSVPMGELLLKNKDGEEISVTLNSIEKAIDFWCEEDNLHKNWSIVIKYAV